MEKEKERVQLNPRKVGRQKSESTVEQMLKLKEKRKTQHEKMMTAEEL